MSKIDSENTRLVNPDASGSPSNENKSFQKRFQIPETTNIATAIILMISSTLLMSCDALFAKASQNEEGKYAYDTAVVIFMTELLKLFISARMYQKESSEPGFVTPPMSLQRFSKFAIPAVLYGINNNTVLIILSYTQPPVLSTLANGRIITTTLLFKILLGREVTPRRWLSVVVLFAGVFLSQLTPEMDFAIPAWLFIAIFAQCALSSLAGVYSESLLKGEPGIPSSINLNNLQLYTWGLAVNIVASLAFHPFTANPFHGFTIWVWGYIFIKVSNGLVISFVLAKLNSVIKQFIAVVALFVQTFISAWLFGFVITGYFLAGLFVTVYSIYLYQSKKREMC